MSFFSPRIPWMPYCVNPHAPFHLWWFLRLPLFSMILTASRSTGLVLCRMPPIGICLMFFLWLNWSYGFWGGRQSASLILSYQGCILLMWTVTVDVDLDHLEWVASVSWFLHCKITPFFSPPFLSYFNFYQKRTSLSSLNWHTALPSHPWIFNMLKFS